MKKLLVMILTFVLACCVLLSGCKEKNTAIERYVYKFQELTIKEDGTELTFEAGEKFEGKRLTEDTMILILEEETAVLRLYSYDNENNTFQEHIEAYIFSWIEGMYNEIYFYDEDGNALIAKKNGNVLTIQDFRNMKVVLEK